MNKTLNDFHSPSCLLRQNRVTFFPNRATIDAYDPRYDQPYPENLAQQAKNRVTISQNRVTIGRPENSSRHYQNRVTIAKLCHDFSASQLYNLKTYTTDLVTGKIVALKKVRFYNLELESVKFMAREMLVLGKLDHPNDVNLEDLVTSRMSCSLYFVCEYMEHDLASLSVGQGVKFT
ncbi:kinase superfamily protein, putative [Medicago truncatula]|uniref:Kinase superfamily protein, putative n=1 Tax=Medicago truncatula TaxID=3880 RepID=A0A072TM95_MEDTR|nr:kinase superfamily protein, putative [Medicago truncatula]